MTINKLNDTVSCLVSPTDTEDIRWGLTDLFVTSRGPRQGVMRFWPNGEGDGDVNKAQWVDAKRVFVIAGFVKTLDLPRDDGWLTPPAGIGGRPR